jgi:hypothetical protein
MRVYSIEDQRDDRSDHVETIGADVRRRIDDTFAALFCMMGWLRSSS